METGGGFDVQGHVKAGGGERLGQDDSASLMSSIHSSTEDLNATLESSNDSITEALKPAAINEIVGCNHVAGDIGNAAHGSNETCCKPASCLDKSNGEKGMHDFEDIDGADKQCNVSLPSKVKALNNCEEIDERNGDHVPTTGVINDALTQFESEVSVKARERRTTQLLPGSDFERELISKAHPVVRRAEKRPGVEFIPGVAPGFSIRTGAEIIPDDAPGFSFRTSDPPHRQEPLKLFVVPENGIQLAQTDKNLQTASSSRRDKVKCLATAAVACFLVGVAIILGLAFSISKRSNGRPGGLGATHMGITTFAPFTTDCESLHAQMQPNVMSQCNCNGNITFVAADISKRYTELTETFIHSVFPDFNESINSCSPRNQALVWMASGAGGTKATSLRQRYTFAFLFILWNGPFWGDYDEWMSSKNECRWRGLKCNGDGTVVNISLSDLEVIVDLPPIATLLTQIQGLTLSGVHFLGNTIPTEVGLLSSLEDLEMAGCNITGTIPKELFNLGDTLKSIDASRNALSGTIPTQIGKLVQLQSLFLDDTKFLEGTIPTELGRCNDLRQMWIGGNTLNGTIPSTIFLKRLEVLDIKDNLLTGTMPTEVGRCESLKLFHVGQNQLKGTLPTELTLLSSLEILNIETNSLHVPDSVCQWVVKKPVNCWGCLCRT